MIIRISLFAVMTTLEICNDELYLNKLTVSSRFKFLHKSQMFLWILVRNNLDFSLQPCTFLFTSVRSVKFRPLPFPHMVIVTEGIMLVHYDPLLIDVWEI